MIDPRSSQAIAQEIPNGKVIVLSPIEGINKQKQQDGIGYLDKMNQDTSSLKGRPSMQKAAAEAAVVVVNNVAYTYNASFLV